MKIHLHIGLEACGTLRLQEVLEAKRAQLENKGVLFPRGPGPKNHSRLFMAVTDPSRPDPLRMARGFGSAQAQATLWDQVAEGLARDVARAKPDVLILSAVEVEPVLGSSPENKSVNIWVGPARTDLCEPFCQE